MRWANVIGWGVLVAAVSGCVTTYETSESLDVNVTAPGVSVRTGSGGDDPGRQAPSQVPTPAPEVDPDQP